MAKMIRMLDAALAHMERCSNDMARLYNSYATGNHSDERKADLVAEMAAAGVELAVHTTAMFRIRDMINGAAREGAVVDTTATVKSDMAN